MLVQQHVERAIRVERLLALTGKYCFFGFAQGRCVCRNDVREMAWGVYLFLKVIGLGIKVVARSAESRDVTFNGLRTGFTW